MKPVWAIPTVIAYEITRALLKRGALFTLRKFWAYELRREMEYTHG